MISSMDQLSFDPARFAVERTQRIREQVGPHKAIVAVSGGVDSTASAALAKKALGRQLTPVLIDTGFLRDSEPDIIKNALEKKPLGLKIKVVRAQNLFIKKVSGTSDAEEKRKRFREAFYQVLGQEAKKANVSYLVQGTIYPDIIETKGGIKTQHNVLQQIGLDASRIFGINILEPLAELYKDQVRELARHLGVPAEISERQPFPGPGLLVRCVGKITRPKLLILKKATSIVEVTVSKFKPDQFFFAVIDNELDYHANANEMRVLASQTLDIKPDDVTVKIFRTRATGVKGDGRIYGQIAGVTVRPDHNIDHEKLTELQTGMISSNDNLARVIFEIASRPKRNPFIGIIRAISTRDYMTADVTRVPLNSLTQIGQAVLRKCKSLQAIYYDITTKPPGTIEFE